MRQLSPAIAARRRGLVWSPVGDGRTGWMESPYWRHAIMARAMCPDGRIRTARLAADADTFFSWPARVSVCGVTVSGFISSASGDTELLEFTPYAYGRNSWVFDPSVSPEAPRVHRHRPSPITRR